MPFHLRTVHAGYAGHAAFYDPQTPPQYPPDLVMEPVHLDIDLFVDIAGEQASGKVTTTVLSRGQGASRLVLDAIAFEDVRVRDLDDHELEWSYDGRKLAINWIVPIKPGEQRRVEVAYRVIRPVDGIHFSQPNTLYPRQAWYAITDHETERARYWLPCIDEPSVRTALDFHLRTESRFTILANGYLVDEIEHEDGTKTAHWRLEHLCPSYLICFALGDFVCADDGVYGDGGQRIPLAYFSTRDHTTDDLLRTFGRTGEMMAWMTAKLGMPFPYPKYYQFAVPGKSGAMENISLVSWNDGMVQDSKLALEWGQRVDDVNLHEMAHSYFGDAIVCRDFAHTWLKESWAVYMVQCWLEDTSTREERDYTYFDDARNYFREADERYQRPIVTRRFESSWQMFDAHTYPGGACRLHTLRKEIGDEVFWTAVRDYLQQYYGEVVETDQFRQVLEAHSGRSLGQFFDQWFYTPGYPDIKVSFSYDTKQQQGTFEVEQRQVDKDKGIPPFVLTTDLGWVIDGRPYHMPIRLDRARQAFVVAMPGAPDQVRFDPDGKVLHKLAFNPGDQMLRQQLIAAPDVIGRILAAQELVKTGKHPNVQAVVDAYEQEPFWGVRREMAQALADANHETAVAGLARLVGQEQDPRVMWALFRAAGSYRDSRILAALMQRLQDDLPYYARQAAYEALGNQRQAAPFDMLLAASEEETYNGIVQSGALRALASTRREEAVAPLLERAAYGATSNRARPAAVAALGNIGQSLEKGQRARVIETLTDLLRDPWYTVRFMAAFSLQIMKAPEAIPALEAYKQRLGHQYHPGVDRIIASLRESDKSDGSAIKKQVEELQQQVRQLEDRVEKLSARLEPGEGRSS